MAPEERATTLMLKECFASQPRWVVANELLAASSRLGGEVAEEMPGAGPYPARDCSGAWPSNVYAYRACGADADRRWAICPKEPSGAASPHTSLPTVVSGGSFRWIARVLRGGARHY